MQYEHSHRLVATAVGLLSIALAIVLHKRRAQDSVLAKMGYVGVALVCFQGLLGGITVLLRLPILITLMHLGTSMGFFCLMVVIALRAHEATRGQVAPDGPRVGHPSRDDSPFAALDSLAALRPWVALGIGLTFAQILLGGTVRHTSSGLACFGVPLCNGELWPSHPGAHWHMSHRFFAAVVAGLVIALAAQMHRRAPGSRPAKLATLASILVLVQITLGVLSVLSLLALSAVTLHLGVAALVLACNVAIFYYLPSYARERDGAPSAVQGRGPRHHVRKQAA